MYKKVIMCLATLAVISVPLAQSLKCYSCNDVNGCSGSIPIVQCDQSNANSTRDVLKQHYVGVKDLNSTDYSCFISRYNAKNTTKTMVDVRGCIMTGAVDCSTQMVNQTLTKHTCKVCKSDSCNYENSVGTFSSSIVAMIVTLVLGKTLVN